MNSIPEKVELQQPGQPPCFVDGWVLPSAPSYGECLTTAGEHNRQKLSTSNNITIAVIAVITIIIIITSALVACFIPVYLKIYESNECIVGQCSQNPFSSCSSIPMESVSGYYWVKSSGGHAVQAFCDTSGPCGISGSWMRVAKLDMEDGNSNCPRSLCIESSIKRNCRLCRPNPTCSSDIYSTRNVSYSKVCGRVIAYQIGTPNAFYMGRNRTVQSIDEIYVDGVSLTYGKPRKHIWTFAADHTENATYIDGCHCNNYWRQLTNPPDFVENDYFCDTADRRGLRYNIFFNGNPLWDGAGCGPDNHCCSFNTPPWFYRQLPHSTAHDIEMRVCRGRTRDKEDIVLEIVEIYVQ